MSDLRLTRYADVLDAFRHRDLRQALYDEGGVVMEDTLLTLHGERHTKRRKLETRIFTRDVFRHIERDVLPTLIAEASAPDLARGGADLVDLGYRISMDLTAAFAGIDRPTGSASETEQLLSLVRTFSEGATLVHSARDKDVVRGEVREALETLDEIYLKPSIARRAALLARFEAGENGEDALPRDVLTVLMRNEDRLHLPPDVVRREIAFYLQAGSHSTANSTTHAMHELFCWAGDGADAWQRLEGDRLFVQRCVHESMRLHPASPVSWRRPVCPTQLADRGSATGQRNVGPDQRIELDMMAANRDPDVFGASANAFDPERELPRTVLPFGLTFGRGAHACPGQDLDAGQVSKAPTAPDARPNSEAPLDSTAPLYGVVPTLVLQLVAWGARPDPADPAMADARTQRANWGRYPVRFTKLTAS